MKYISSNTKQIYSVEFTRKNDTCPECSHNRKNKTHKCLQYYSDTNSAYCFNCQTTFLEYRPHESQKQYIKPENPNQTKLTDKALNWFKGRGINQTTIINAKLYSINEWMPQFNREVECICFPYYKSGELINIKFRGPGKSFKLFSGAELILWNIDQLSNNKEIIITEGEIDALTFMQVGSKNVVSVPNGANNNLEYLDNYIGLFEDIEKVYIAVDVDEKGLILRDELIRRIGQEKCYIVSFKECKDANEFLNRYSASELKEQLKNAKSIPVSGIVEVKDFYSDIIELYEKGIQRGKLIEVSDIDNFISWELGRLATVTGRPGSGKSEFVDYLITKLNLIHGWKIGIFSPENYPLKFHYSKLHEKLSGQKFRQSNEAEFDTVYEHINYNVFYILNEEDMSVKTVLDGAKYLVKQKGIKILVIDPYNKLEHDQKSGQSETQYISKFLDTLGNFARFNNVLIFLVAHPRKMEYDKIPTLYDIAGSANFYNKTDYGFTVHRMTNDDGIMENEVQVHWQKIKFKHLGEQGISELKYNYNNGRFEPKDKTVDFWDNSNWLVSGKQDIIEPNYEFDTNTLQDEAPF